VERGEDLFPRLNLQAEIAKCRAGRLLKKLSMQKTGRKKDDLITLDQFQQVDLRVAEIVTAERIPKSDKLLRIEVSWAPEENSAR
jgi:methionyl-tRNA synthetase